MCGTFGSLCFWLCKGKMCIRDRDSSLVCSVAAKLLKKPIETFAIGMDTDAIDLKYAREVAEYIGSHHHEVIITKEDVLEALPKVVALLGTYDITTIRASIGMYLSLIHI